MKINWLKDFFSKSHPVVIGLFLIAFIVMPLKLIFSHFGLENHEATEGIEELFALNGKKPFLLLKIMMVDSVLEEIWYRGPLFLVMTLFWFFNIKISLKNQIILASIILPSVSWALHHPFWIIELLSALIYCFINLTTWPWPGSLILHLLFNGFIWARYYFSRFF